MSMYKTLIIGLPLDGIFRVGVRGQGIMPRFVESRAMGRFDAAPGGRKDNDQVFLILD
jgi:hypothetical protein